MANEKLVISEFIETYKSFPCLWKVKSKEYSDRNAKSHAYDVLKEKLLPIDPEANRDLVVKKINSIRTAYRKELKKVMKSEKSGAGEDDIYVPHLWYFKLLHFLKDQEVTRATKSNIEEVQSPGVETIFEFPESPTASLPLTLSPSVLEASSRPMCKAFNKRSRGVKNKCDEVLDVIGKRLAQPSNVIADKFSDIGKAWALKLRELDVQQAVHAEKLINNVFYEAQLGNLNRSCFLQIQQEYSRTTQPPFNIQQSSFNTHPPFSTQPTYNTQPPLTTQPTYNTQTSFTTQPTYNTQTSFLTQPTYNTQTSFTTQPTYNTQPSTINRTDTDFHRKFGDIVDKDT